MKKQLYLLIILLTIYKGTSFSQVYDTIVEWTFPTTSADSVADGGIATNLNQTIQVLGGTGTPAYTTSDGITCVRVDGWDNGKDLKYWQIKFSTTDYKNLYFTSKQRSNSSGPKYFNIQYKIGSNGTWTDMSADTVTISSASTWEQVITDALPTACNDVDLVYMRWIMRDTMAVSGTKAVSSSGTSSITDIKIWGESISGVSPTVPPTVERVYVLTANTVNVVFSTPLNNTAEDVSNYTGLGTISSATRSDNLDTVTLVLESSLISGNSYTLTVSVNIQDTADVSMSASMSSEILFNNSIANLVFTEIMYNDPSHGQSGDTLEFIEIYNNSAETASIGGYKLQHSSSLSLLYSIPAATTLASGKYMVFARDAGSLDNFFGISDSYEWTSGQLLSNKGEYIQIVNTTGDIIDSLTYGTSSPWDTLANGNGASLTLCNADNDNSIGSNWQASTIYAGLLDSVAVYATPSVGCNDTSDTTSGTIVTESISTYSCYPNPAENDLFVTTENDLTGSLVIYTIYGAIVYQKEFSANTTVDVSNWLPGVYVVCVNNSAPKRLLIKH